MKMFQYIDMINKSSSLQSLAVTTLRLHLNYLITNDIFSSLTDIDMSLLFFVDWLWLLKENVVT